MKDTPGVGGGGRGRENWTMVSEPNSLDKLIFA